MRKFADSDWVGCADLVEENPDVLDGYCNCHSDAIWARLLEVDLKDGRTAMVCRAMRDRLDELGLTNEE